MFERRRDLSERSLSTPDWHSETVVMGYLCESSSVARPSPITRAPAEMSSDPTRCRERENRGDWSS